MALSDCARPDPEELLQHARRRPPHRRPDPGRPAPAARGHRIFGVPGESYLAVLDALHDHARPMPFVVCRQEGGAAMMAEAYGKLTGEPGICIVTRGPGATNASAGIHIAYQDSTPMILFIGQVARGMIEREAFQEIDYRRMFGADRQMGGADRRRGAHPRASSAAPSTSRRPAAPARSCSRCPRTCCATRSRVADADALSPRRAASRPPRTWQRCGRMLAAAKRPLAILGGGGWDAQACGASQRFAERIGLPVAASLPPAGSTSTTSIPATPARSASASIRSSCGALRRGRPAARCSARGSARCRARATRCSTFPTPKQTLVHVHAGAEELGRVYQPDLPINAGARAFAAALDGLEPVDGTRWAGVARAGARRLRGLAAAARDARRGADGRGR